MPARCRPKAASGDPAVDEDVCASTTQDDGRPHDAALICADGQWQAVEDGPCMPVGS